MKVNSINQSQYAAIVAELKEALRQNADNAVADSMQRFFTEHVNCLGVKMPQITSVINGFHQKHDSVSAPQILAISNEYLQSAEYNEDVFVGYGLVRRHIKQYDEQFIFQMRDWIERYASNWAHVDDLCLKTIYPYLLNNPNLIEQIRFWSSSESPWCRRASNVAWVKFVCRKIGKKEYRLNTDLIFSQCHSLLSDDDIYVQKSIGWLLKVTSQYYPEQVLQFIDMHKPNFQRLTINYALEKYDNSVKQKFR